MKFNIFCVFVLMVVVLINGEKDTDIFSICSTSQLIHLDPKGVKSSVTLALVPSEQSSMIPKQCRIQIKAPDTHFIYVRLVDWEQEKEALFQQQQQQEQQGSRDFEGEERVQAGRKVHSKRSGGSLHSCPLHVFQNNLGTTQTESASLAPGPPGNEWSTDACAISVPNEGTLFGNHVQVNWTPPIPSLTKFAKERNERLKNRRIIITALGKGDACQSKDQHVCIQVGWTPLLCVSQELMCDGIVHCPPGGLLGDENPQFCKDRNIHNANNWEKIATEFLKKFTGKTKPGSLLPAIQKDNNKWSDNWKSTETPMFDEYEDTHNKNSTSPDGISTTFQNYGPWGYLMLGMLICGTVLTFCGLWECCCKRTKPHHQHLDNTPTASTIAGSGIPTAVLVLGGDSHADRSSPPNYEDLDQPPSYSALFPEQKENEATVQHGRPRGYEEVNS